MALLPPDVLPEEEEKEEEAYQDALEATMQPALEESRREEDTRCFSMQEALALSAAGDCVIPPSAPPLAFFPEPKPEPQSTEHEPEVYQWTSQLREWVSAPPVWLGATPEQEVAYLQQWRARTLADERAEGARQMERECRLALEVEEEHLEREEEERARAATVQPPPPTAGGTNYAGGTDGGGGGVCAWEVTFP